MGALFSSRRPKLPEEHDQKESTKKNSSFITRLFGKDDQKPDQQPDSVVTDQPELTQLDQMESVQSNILPTQSGGGKNIKYHFIINPKTGRRVSVFGVTGKKIIQHYLKNIQNKT